MEEFFTAHNVIFSMFGCVIAFFMYRIDKKFDKIDARFDKIDDRFDKVDQRFAAIEVRLTSIESRLSKIEGFLWREFGSFSFSPKDKGEADQG